MSINVKFDKCGEIIIVQANRDDLIKNIIEKYYIKGNITDRNYLFLYGGLNVNQNSKLREINNTESEINIIVINQESEREQEEKYIKSKYVICPICKKNSIMKMKNYKIFLEDCDNQHISANLIIDEIENYKDTQLIDQSKILCSQCKINRKSNTFEKKFYRCFSCNKDLCPLCKESHQKQNNAHYIIDYENINYYCNKHQNERFISYCKDCNKNLCLLCETEHNKKHNLIDFKNIIPRINLNFDEMNKTFKDFQKKIKEIKNIFDKVESNLIIYSKMINEIKDNYNISNRNYQVLKSAENIHDYNINIINDMKNILNKNEIKEQIEDIIEMFNYMTIKDYNNENNAKNRNRSIRSSNNNTHNNSSYNNIDINKSTDVKLSDNDLVNYENKDENMEKNTQIILNQMKEANNTVNSSLNNQNHNDKIKESFTNEIMIKYKDNPNEKDIMLIGKNFINNNRKNIELYFNGNKLDILLKYNKNNYKLKNIFEVKIKIINPLTNMSYMFYDCSSIISISDLHKIDTSQVTDMSYAFGGCSSLESLQDISRWDTSNVTSMKFMFGECKSLTELDISKWNTKNVVDISYMFCSCIKLVQLPDISKWDISKIKDMSGLFSGCSNLRNIDSIYNWNLKKVTNASYMFSNCTSLSTKITSNIQLPENAKKENFHK